MKAETRRYCGAAPHNAEFLKSKKIGSEIVSNLELQMALYFNVVFFPFWLVTEAFILSEKYNSVHDLHRIITTVAIIILIPTEGVRLYLGYVGNLLERIPELAGFWMLSLLLQCPLQTFLLLGKGEAAEKAVHFVLFVMLLTELVFGFVALKQISQHPAKCRISLLEWLQENGWQDEERNRMQDFTKIDLD